MASSDDEGEAVPDAVTNYHFVNERDEPVSFSELPVQWNDGEVLDGKGKQIFLHGHADIQKIYKQVVAWKFDLSDAKPQILVLSKEKIWMKLQKPRKSYEDTIRTILITVHCLHSARKNPELSGKSLWDQLSKVFSLYEVRPSENDLIDHANMISEAVEKDETLKKSKFLVPFLEEKPRKKKALDEDIGATTNFIVDDDMIEEFEEYDGSDEEDDLFDSVCAICDNGGDILCCEGRCMRSFHATVEAGADSSCESLGLTNEQVEAIQSFFCKNCQYKRHQCFFCGELGSSDKSTGAEVFPCVSATCGRFYHPRCVSKLLHRESAAEAEELQTKIAHGESFTCPVHRCIVCKQGENKMDPDLQFAVCRRCPKSYHRKCLPKKIAFEDVDDEDIIQRAWEGLIPNRILIYCLKHEIDDELGTPIRKHIKFPDDGQKNKKQILERLQKKEKVLQKKRVLDSADACRKGSHEKLQKGVDLPSVKAEDGSSKKTVRRLPSPNPLKKQKGGDSSIKALNRSASTKVTKSIDENKMSLGNMLYDIHFIPGSTSVKSKKEETPDSEPKQTVTDKPVAKERDDSFPLDDASKKKILTLVKNASSSITLEKIIANHKMPTTDGYSSRNVVDKSLTLGKVQGTVEAICAALEKLKDGGSVEDAKIVCEPELLNQMVRWKSKIGGYISPFLNGARYTSFGRHFTKVDKLKEIVDLLHCYVQDGDMMVDFCCGSNDFSWLMKEKLEKIGTKCSYKNYDLVQAKNDFNFEKRDWMTVHPKELPSGSKLIMGLNPPFGKNARDANKFIDKALEFKPKLLILIAPPQTERLDKKDPPYDLIWEDDEMLAGKSFYLPGSIDVNHNQLDDWNVTTSLLNLWSRSDWTAKHKAIAQKHGHLSRLQQTNSETELETLVSDVAVEVHDLNSKIPFSIDVNPVQNVAREARILGSDKEGFPSNKDEKEVREHNNSSQGKNHSNGDSKKRRRDKGKRGRESGETSPALKEKGINHERGRSDKGKRGRESSEMSPAFKEKGPTQERGRSDKGKRGRESTETSPAVKERALSQERTLTETYNKLPRLSPQIGSRRRSLEDARSSEPPEFGHYGTGYGENRESDIDITHGWPSGTSPSRGRDYGVRNPVEQFPGYQRETMDGVRNPLEQFPGYQRDTMDNHGRRTYVAGLEQNCATDSSIRAHLGLYGQQQQQYPDALGGQRIDRYSVGGDPGQQQQQYPDALGGQRIDRYSVGGDPGYSLRYGQLGPSAGPSYDQMSNAMSMSTMSRYAPQLNEMNHMRVNPLAAVPPSHTLGRNVIPDAFAPPVGYRGDPMGFPPDPYRHFPQYNNSPGW